jgi:hypothetical protein
VPGSRGALAAHVGSPTADGWPEVPARGAAALGNAVCAAPPAWIVAARASAGAAGGVLLAGAPADVGAPEGLEVRAAGAGVAGPVEGVGPAADGALVTAGRPAGAGRCGAGVGRPIAGPAGALAECDDAARAATDGLGATVRRTGTEAPASAAALTPASVER